MERHRSRDCAAAGGLFFPSAGTTRNQNFPPELFPLRCSWGGRQANLSIGDVLLLTCIGTFIASATYGVTLLH
jgi:hypothetical protein